MQRNAAGTWAKPKSTSGKRPSRSVLAESLGIQLATFNILLALAKQTLLTPPHTALLNSPHGTWNCVDPALKRACIVAFRTAVAEAGSSDPDAQSPDDTEHGLAMAILEDDTVAAYFLHAQFAVQRAYMKRIAAYAEDAANTGGNGSGAGSTGASPRSPTTTEEGDEPACNGTDLWLRN